MSENAFTPGPWVTRNGTDVFTSLGATNASGTKADGDDAWHIADCSAAETFVGGVMESMPHSEKVANAHLIAAAPELFAEVEREYAELADIHNSWPGRDTPAGQHKLGRLRDLIAKATGRDPQAVQDDYGMRATKARGQS